MIYMRQLITLADSMNIRSQKRNSNSWLIKFNILKVFLNWFDNINSYIKKKHKKINLSHYVISAGHHEILESTAIRNKLTNVFGSQYYFDDEGNATFPQKCGY